MTASSRSVVIADLGLGNLAARLSESFASAKGPRGASQQLARPLVVAELGHRNATHGAFAIVCFDNIPSLFAISHQNFSSHFINQVSWAGGRRLGHLFVN